MAVAKKIGAASILFTMATGFFTFAKGFIETLNAKVTSQNERLIILETKEISQMELLREVRDDVKKLLSEQRRRNR